MSDFMMSQVQGLLAKVTEDLDKMNKTSNAQTDMLLGAINDLAANLFATQGILSIVLRDHPVDAKAVKEWIAAQAGGSDQAPKSLAIAEQLLSLAKK